MSTFKKVYLDQVVEEQGRLYGDAADAGYDMQDLSDKYMSSLLKEQMDKGRAYWLTRFGWELMPMLQEEVTLVKSKETQHGFLNEWIGQMYAYVQWKTEISSRELIIKLPYKELARIYSGLHDRSLEEAGDLVAKLIQGK